VVRFAKNHGYFSSVQPLACFVTKEQEHAQIAAAFLENLPSYITDPALLRFVVWEILAKVIAYRDLPKGFRIKIPGEGEHIVEEVFDLWGKIPAFVLSSDSGVILLFRGTDPTFWTRRGLASLITDIDPKGPGYSLYLRARPQIRSFIARRPARAVGFSLGGSLATYMALFEGELLDPSRPSIAFNPPGLRRHAVKKWDALLVKPPLVIYASERDFICRAGRLVGDVRIISGRKMRGPLDAHLSFLSMEES